MPDTKTPTVRIVCATREDREGFLTRTATGRSFALLQHPGLELSLQERNSEGLPAIYNRAIDAARNDPAILVFVHDDVILSDLFWTEHLYAALTHFHVVGVAGNARRVPRQPGWAFVDLNFTWDEAAFLSGALGHGQGFPPDVVSYYGPSHREVKLLDGCLLVAYSQTLIDRGVRFDERFSFHFYDMDFCRAAERAGLKMGTWPISVVHQSGGRFNTPEWNAAYRDYVAKWND